MKIGLVTSKGKLIASGSVLLAAAVLALFAFGGTTQADSPHAGLNFWIEAVGESGCDTSAGDAVCFIEPGSTFVINVNLDPLPQDIPGYEGFDIVINYTGLTSLDDGNTDAWPECANGFGATNFQPGTVAMACAIGLPPEVASTYDGTLGTNSFTCDQSGSITLAGGPSNTDLVETVGLVHDEGTGSDETLNITCGDPPTATSPAATSTAVPATATATVGGISDTGTGSNSSSSSAPWAMISLLAAAAVAGLGVAGWRFARR